MNFIFKDLKFELFENIIISLRKIKGIGFERSKYICGLLGFRKNLKFVSLNKYYFFLLTYLLKNNYGLEIFLTRIRANNLKFFLFTKSYKSIKYLAGLPIRGQRTHTNAKTAKNLNKKVK